MATIRDKAVSMHNAGEDETVICAELAITKGEFHTKLAQSRREGALVRPDDMTPAEFFKQFPKLAPKTRETKPAPIAPTAPIAAASAPAKARKKPEPRAIDYIALVKSWNTDPVVSRVALEFNLPENAVSQIIGRLRCDGVPLLKAKRKNARPSIDELTKAAIEVLPPDMQNKLRYELAAELRKAETTGVPS